MGNLFKNLVYERQLCRGDHGANLRILNILLQGYFADRRSKNRVRAIALKESLLALVMPAGKHTRRIRHPRLPLSKQTHTTKTKTSKQASKQTDATSSKQVSKQASKQSSEQSSKHASKRASKRRANGRAGE